MERSAGLFARIASETSSPAPVGALVDEVDTGFLNRRELEGMDDNEDAASVVPLKVALTCEVPGITAACRALAMFTEVSLSGWYSE